MRKGTLMQMLRRWEIVALCLGAVVLSGCGKKADKGQSAQPAGPAGTQASASDTAAPDYAKLAEQNRQAMTEMNKGKVIEAVPGATLKALLPEELPGMKRTDATAERTQAMGYDTSNAEGQYNATDNSGGRVKIKITDTGNMSGSVRLGMSAWAMGSYSRETDTGYEKTTTVNGCKGMEKYDTKNKEGSLQLLAADRFIVDVEGYNVTMDVMKQAVDKIDLKKLAAAAPK
jgi:hypothetical protein